MKNILKLYKGLEESKERFIDETFEKEIYTSVRPQLTIIDGGAYGGEFSFYCLPFAKKIYAFEPDPRPYDIFKQLIEEFELSDVIELSDKALAGSNGRRVFHNSGYGGSSIKGKDDAQGDGDIEVETITLANVIKDNKIEQVDILKVDMENSEGEVFEALDFSEVQGRIKMIIGEHLDGSKSTLESFGFNLTHDQENFVFKR